MNPQDELKAYVASLQDGCLTVTFSSSMDSISNDWARGLITNYPGPYSAVRLNLSASPRLTSTFFAGLMMLHTTYTGKDVERITLIGVDRRTQTNLQILRLDGYFTFVS